MCEDVCTCARYSHLHANNIPVQDSFSKAKGKPDVETVADEARVISGVAFLLPVRPLWRKSSKPEDDIVLSISRSLELEMKEEKYWIQQFRKLFSKSKLHLFLEDTVKEKFKKKLVNCIYKIISE